MDRGGYVVVKLPVDGTLPPHPWRSFGSQELMECEDPCDLVPDMEYQVICDQYGFYRIVETGGLDALYPFGSFIVEDASPSPLHVRFGRRWRVGCIAFESYFSSLYETDAVSFTPLPEILEWARWLVSYANDRPRTICALAEQGRDEVKRIVSEIIATGELDIAHFYPEDQLNSELTFEQWQEVGFPVLMGGSYPLSRRRGI